MRYVFSVLAFAATLYAQSFQGSLRGRITDPKSATIPLARITIVDEGTGAARSTLRRSKEGVRPTHLIWMNNGVRLASSRFR